MTSSVMFSLLGVVWGMSVLAAVLTFRIPPPLAAKPGSGSDFRHALGNKTAAVVSANSEEVEKELLIVGKPYGELVYEQLLLCAVFGLTAFVGIFFLGESIVLGLASVPLFAALGWVMPKRSLRREAAEKRFHMRQAVTVFQELGAAALAGGAEINAALRNASSYGEGPEWARLRTAVRESINSDTTFSRQIQDLAELYELSELRNLANLLTTAELGGTAQTSLEEMSIQQAALAAQDSVDRAEKNTAQLIIPTGLIFSSFALFIFFTVIDGLNQINF